MKRPIGYLASWALYWLGHWTSMLIGNNERRTDRIVFAAYTAIMDRSLAVQDWGGGYGPWSKA